MTRASCVNRRNLPPVLIFKRKTLPKDIILSGILIHIKNKGWMDEIGMKLCVKKYG